MARDELETRRELIPRALWLGVQCIQNLDERRLSEAIRQREQGGYTLDAQTIHLPTRQHAVRPVERIIRCPYTGELRGEVDNLLGRRYYVRAIPGRNGEWAGQLDMRLE